MARWASADDRSTMTRLRRRSLALIGALVLAPASAGRTQIPSRTGSSATTTPPLRVMTFNLRLDLASDGPNAWPHRRDWVAALIRFHAPDVVGVQEALAPMLADLDARLPGFARIGVGRADGRSG